MPDHPDLDVSLVLDRALLRAWRAWLVGHLVNLVTAPLWVPLVGVLALGIALHVLWIGRHR